MDFSKFWGGQGGVGGGGYVSNPDPSIREEGSKRDEWCAGLTSKLRISRVIWFNLGTHHVPHTGDIPNTLMTTSASSVMFAPHNFHLRDRSRALNKWSSD